MSKSVKLMVTSPYYEDGELRHDVGELFDQGAKLPQGLVVTEVIHDDDPPAPGWSVPEYGEATATEAVPVADHGETAVKDPAKATREDKKAVKADPAKAAEESSGFAGDDQAVAAEAKDKQAGQPGQAAEHKSAGGKAGGRA